MRHPAKRPDGRIRQPIAAVVAILMLVGVAAACVPPTSPTPPAAPKVQYGPQTLPANASSMWQTDDAVWALAYSNHVVFAGGDFSTIRPPGAARGTNSFPQHGLAAFHADGPYVGTPCNRSHPCPGFGYWDDKNVTARVWALNVSPDKKTLYVGGDFTYVGGQPRSKLVAFDLSRTGAPQLNWNPSISGGTVRAIASTNSAVYAGGSFSSAAGAARTRLAAWWAADKRLIADFDPQIDNSVFALTVGPPANDANRLVLGGTFRQVNGAAHSGIAQVDLRTGRVNGPMDNTIIPGVVGQTRSDVKALITDDRRIYLAAEGTGAGIFDGTASVDPTTGKAIWQNTCLGATQALAKIGNILYLGSHSHNCNSAPRGGFPQNPFETGTKSWHHLTAEQAVADSDPSSGGQLLTWYPTVNSGPTNAAQPNELGPRALATDGSSVFVGGQSTTVNGVPQQGLTRFSPGPDRTAPTRPYVKSSSPAAGRVTVRWTSSSDPDSRYLTYRVTRSDTPNVVRYTVSNAYSPWWVNQSYVYRDNAAPAGARYTVTVTNGTLSSSSSTTPVRTSGYARAVLADRPSLYWRLNEPSGTVAKDVSGNGANGRYYGTSTRGVGGALSDDKAIAMNGAQSSSISQARSTYAPPREYSLEMWFRLTNRSGGRLIGWSSSPTGTSGSIDRTVYETPSGQVVYATQQPSTDPTRQCELNNDYYVQGWCYAWSKQDYNDGGWHHLVATQSATGGMKLYIDNILVSAMPNGNAPTNFAGVWKVGGDRVNGLPRAFVGAGGWNGGLDDVAVYPFVLSQAQVTAHYIAGQ